MIASTPQGEGGEVWLGEFSTDELLTVGFDGVGVMRPLLAGSDAPDGATARRVAAEGLRDRGLLVPGTTGWRCAGPLEVVLYGRAAARLTAEALVGNADGSTVRTLIFGMLTADGEEVLVMEAQPGGQRYDCRTVRRARAAARIVDAAFCGVPDVVDGRVDGPDAAFEVGDLDAASDARGARIEAQRTDGPDRAGAAWRLGLLPTPPGPRLVVGGNAGGAATGWTMLASRATATAAVATVLAGRSPAAPGQRRPLS